MIESILDKCLEDIRLRRATIHQCLAKYPDFAEELAPLLRLALAVEGLGGIKASEDFKHGTRVRLLGQPPPRRSSKRLFGFLAAGRA